MAAGVSRRSRLAHLARQRSLSATATTASRVVRRELACRRSEFELAVAARTGRPVVVGPFLGEVGFELLYWLPMLRRLLRRHAVPPERVTVVTRGGAAAWYADIAGHELDILDLLSPADFGSRLAERRRSVGDAKQLTVERLDRDLAAAVLDRVGDATVVHPIVMYTRLRWIWQGARPVSDIHRHVTYRKLDASGGRLPDRLAALVPESYVAVKPYFSDSFPDSLRNRAFLRELVEQLAAETDVVLLATGHGLDEHIEWVDDVDSRVHAIGSLLDPRDNLAVQTKLVASARALVSTYGGFSYLGAFLGVPTVAFHATRAFVRAHLDVLREALPHAEYVLRQSDAHAVAHAAVGR